MHAPQSSPTRRALFRVHRWAGIGAGLYIAVASISGSAVVFRRELAVEFTRPPAIVAGPGERLSEAELRSAAQRAYPGYEIREVFIRMRDEGQPAEITLAGEGRTRKRLFHPYTGADLGDSVRAGYRVVEWLVDLHANLLGGETGRVVNGLGGIFLAALAVTGAFIWWPGAGRWRGSLIVRRREHPRGLNWSLHSAAGFWSLAFLLLWAVSGIYLCFPDPFHGLVDFLEPAAGADAEFRAGDNALFWLARLHFGRFGGTPVKILWTVAGLAPAVLFATGFAVWWKGRSARAGARTEEYGGAALSQQTD